jgi:hypothetical protein
VSFFVVIPFCKRAEAGAIQESVPLFDPEPADLQRFGFSEETMSDGAELGRHAGGIRQALS